MKETTEDTETRSVELGNKTRVQLGLIITLIGAAVAVIWWAATITAKMDQVLTNQAAALIVSNGHSKDIDDLKAWRAAIDQTGTPKLAQRVGEIEKALTDINRRLDLHEARTASKP